MQCFKHEQWEYLKSLPSLLSSCQFSRISSISRMKLQLTYPWHPYQTLQLSHIFYFSCFFSFLTKILKRLLTHVIFCTILSLAFFKLHISLIIAIYFTCRLDSAMSCFTHVFPFQNITGKLQYSSEAHPNLLSFWTYLIIYTTTCISMIQNFYHLFMYK